MTGALTHRQAELVEFLRTHTRANGISPTVRECGVALGVKAPSLIARMIDALVAKGRIRRLPRQARSIEVLPDAEHHFSDCICDRCANARYAAQIRLIKAINVAAPLAIRNDRASNFQRLPDESRAALLGIKPFKAAPVRGAAIPSGVR